jgi:hypothetical protein
MRRLLPTGALALVLATSACSSGGIHGNALQRAVGTTYQRLYVLQQEQLGNTVASPDDTAACVRSGSTGHSGAGSWVCTVHFPYPDGHIVPASFDVEVQPIGCYTATGPPTIVGQLSLTTPAGKSVTNPLFAFDGCFKAS